MKSVEMASHPEAADVFIFNKVPNFNLYKMAKSGVKIVMDVDDYWRLPEDHPYYKTWMDEDVA
jgi:hypothetical protein